MLVELKPAKAPAIIRLRRALKTLLRAFGGRAVSVESVAPTPTTAARGDDDDRRGRAQRG